MEDFKTGFLHKTVDFALTIGYAHLLPFKTVHHCHQLRRRLGNWSCTKAH